jgi:hypothetical protein
MAFVLDASVSACWAFADEDHPIADVAFSSLQTEEAVVPACGGSKSATFLS